MKGPAVAALALLLVSSSMAASQEAEPGRLKAAEELARLVYAAESRGDIAGTLVDIRIQTASGQEEHLPRRLAAFEGAVGLGGLS